jgi:hypothetical protein
MKQPGKTVCSGPKSILVAQGTFCKIANQPNFKSLQFNCLPLWLLSCKISVDGTIDM